MDKIIINEAPIIALFYDKVCDLLVKCNWIRINPNLLDLRKVRKVKC
jgi:hypothetical protein